VIKNIGLSAASVSILGTGISSATGTSPEEDGSRNETEIRGSDAEVEPEAITNAQASFSPYTVETGENTTLSCSWDFQAIIPPANWYQIDILVEKGKTSQPETVSQNIGEADVTKDWVSAEDTPVGDAWHWQGKFWTADIVGTHAAVDAEMEAEETGEVEAKAGTYHPLQAWSTTTLDIE